MKRKIIMGLLVAVALIGSVMLLRWAETQPSSNSKSFQLVGETVSYVEYPDGQAFLFSEPTAKTAEEFAAYVNRSHYRVSLIEASEEIKATVTFRQPLTMSEALAVLGNPVYAGLDFALLPQGGGLIAYPSDSATIQDIQNFVQSQSANGSSYIFRGYVAGTITANGEELRRIASDSKVAVVDVGPQEYKLSYSSAAIRSTRNVWLEIDGLKLLPDNTS